MKLGTRDVATGRVKMVVVAEKRNRANLSLSGEGSGQHHR